MKLATIESGDVFVANIFVAYLLSSGAQNIFTNLNTDIRFVFNGFMFNTSGPGERKRYA